MYVINDISRIEHVIFFYDERCIGKDKKHIMIF